MANQSRTQRSFAKRAVALAFAVVLAFCGVPAVALADAAPEESAGIESPESQSQGAQAPAKGEQPVVEATALQDEATAPDQKTITIAAYNKTEPFNDNQLGGTVTFAGSNEKSSGSASKAFFEGDEVKVVASAADGFQFAGWAKNDPAGDIVSKDTEYGFTVDGTVDMLYAVFYEMVYITFDANGGTPGWHWLDGEGFEAGTEVEKGVVIGEDIILPPDGKVFDGIAFWKNSAPEDVTVYEPNSTIHFFLTEDVTMKYLWRDPQVTFRWSSLEGLDLQDPLVTQPVPAGSTAADALATIGKTFDDDLFTKVGYWDFDYRLPKPMTEYKSISDMAAACITADYVVKDDVVFYVAMFDSINALDATLTFDLAGGMLDGQTGKVTKTVAVGSIFKMPVPTREGYTFKYWEGSQYKAGQEYTVEGDHTFTAVWEKNAAPAEKTNTTTSAKSSTTTPKTGDDIPLMGIVSAAIAAAILGLVAARRRSIRR